MWRCMFHRDGGSKKKEKHKKVLGDAREGYSIPELAALHGMSYNAVKGIVLGRNEK